MNAAVDPQFNQLLEVQRHNQRFKDQVHALTDKCWDICVDKPGTKLSGTNEKCISNCVNRFIDANNYVLQRLGETMTSAAATSSEELLSQ